MVLKMLVMMVSGHHVVEDGFRQGQGVAKGVCEEEGEAGLQT